MTDRELMQKALDALERENERGAINDTLWMPSGVETIFDFLRAAIAQPEPEPVAWQVIPEGVSAKPLTEMKAKHIIDRDGYVVGGYILDRETDICLVHHSAVRWMKYDELFQILHVTAPPQREWQGLTDGEIWKMDAYRNAAPYEEVRVLYLFARAIEAKLKEKNT